MGSKERWICDRLVEHGKRLLDAPKELIQFTNDDGANQFLNDLDRYPHAYVLACLMAQQVKAEKAWLIPYRFQERLKGDFSIGRLAALSVDEIKYHMTHPVVLHRFVDRMSVFFHAAVDHVVRHYEGEASRIWQDNPSSAEVVYRFLEFKGVGQKIATMAANILAREFKIPFADYYSIDISADVHVRRVFGRLGLTSSDATEQQLIFRARSIYPEFPGLMDFPAWDIGKNWCKPSSPDCGSCYMNHGCPSAEAYMKRPR